MHEDTAGAAGRLAAYADRGPTPDRAWVAATLDLLDALRAALDAVVALCDERDGKRWPDVDPDREWPWKGAVTTDAVREAIAAAWKDPDRG